MTERIIKQRKTALAALEAGPKSVDTASKLSTLANDLERVRPPLPPPRAR